MIKEPRPRPRGLPDSSRLVERAGRGPVIKPSLLVAFVTVSSSTSPPVLSHDRTGRSRHPSASTTHERGGSAALANHQFRTPAPSGSSGDGQGAVHGAVVGAVVLEGAGFRRRE